MTQGEQTEFSWRVDAGSEDATRALARDVACMVGADDLVTLTGDLGSGKTAFARALIRALIDDAELEVPSPTFTIIQVYHGKLFPIVHADLYRIKSPDELAQLGWEETSQGALVLVEWADRAGDQLPPDRLDVSFELVSTDREEARDITLTGFGGFAPRVKRAKALHEFLARAGWSDAQREFMQGDASARAYERLRKPDGQNAILMISPQRPDGPPLRSGKPYSAIAHLAENITPFIALDAALRAQSLSAPEIFAYDLDAGFAVLEDLGAETIVEGEGPIPDRYAEAASVLAFLHSRQLPDTLPVEGRQPYAIPPYDLEALLIETELLIDWYAPAYSSTGISERARSEFAAIWKALLADILAERSWTLRDYHSPNIIWLPGREGLQRVGILDFQDCVLGSPAYDVASLLQDARVTVSDELELRLLSHYARKRRDSDSAFHMARFARSYAVLGAQRATKILGIFARLDKRDHKPQYLAHLPRVQRYLIKNLAHPELAALKTWYETHVPGLFSRPS